MMNDHNNLSEFKFGDTQRANRKIGIKKNEKGNLRCRKVDRENIE
jgi:hypothetical protein